MVKRDKELRQAFADRVNRLREEQGLSWKELAAKAGTDVSTLFRWRSRGGPHLETIAHLSQALGVSTDYLLLGQAPEQTAAQFSPLRRAIEETPRSLRVALCRALLPDPRDSSGRRAANDTHAGNEGTN